VALEMALLTDEDGERLFPTWNYDIVTVNGEEVKSPIGWSRVRGMMSTGIKDDKIFYISMSSTDPKEAYYLAKVAKQVAPDVLNVTVGVGTVKVLSDPVLDTAADSPNVLRNAVLVALVAAVLVYVAFFLRDLFDTTVYTEEDLASFGLPILGTVPSFPSSEGERAAKDKGVHAS
jgi:capsular polysaccharide biosynthesis protein